MAALTADWERRRVGSATFAKVTGTITPAGNGPYRFGGGGGLLEVSGALTNAPSSPTEPRGVVVESNSDRPLTLLLSGANTYSGSTSDQPIRDHLHAECAYHGRISCDE